MTTLDYIGAVASQKRSVPAINSCKRSLLLGETRRDESFGWMRGVFRTGGGGDMKYLAEVWRPPMQASWPPRGLRSRSQEGDRSVVVVLAVENRSVLAERE